MKIFNDKSTLEKRRHLRKQSTPAEIKLWNHLRNKSIFSIKCRRQHGIGPFIIDFYFPAIKLAIEIDGDSHFLSGAEVHDQNRTNYLNSLGIKVLRFTNTDIYQSIDNVVKIIIEHLPSPLLNKGGE